MRNFKLIAVAIAAFTLAACETVQGVGQDVANTGDAITEGSQQVQSDL